MEGMALVSLGAGVEGVCAVGVVGPGLEGLAETAGGDLSQEQSIATLVARNAAKDSFRFVMAAAGRTVPAFSSAKHGGTRDRTKG
jgi:hypothetical protein